MEAYSLKVESWTFKPWTQNLKPHSRIFKPENQNPLTELSLKSIDKVHCGHLTEHYIGKKSWYP